VDKEGDVVKEKEYSSVGFLYCSETVDSAYCIVSPSQETYATAFAAFSQLWELSLDWPMPNIRNPDDYEFSVSFRNWLRGPLDTKPRAAGSVALLHATGDMHKP